MALYVNTNVSSINGQRNLAKSTRQLDGVYQKLSSSLRINSAKDDAAGLQISDRMTVQIDGLTQGNRNCNDGISICQTMEGALDEITNMLERIRTLAVQSANGSNSSDEREALQQEVTDLTNEILRIGAQTTYGKNLYCFNENPPAPGSTIGQNGKITFHVGAYKDNTVDVVYRSLSGILGAALDNLTPMPQMSALTTTMLDLATSNIQTLPVSSIDSASLTSLILLSSLSLDTLTHTLAYSDVDTATLSNANINFNSLNDLSQVVFTALNNSQLVDSSVTVASITNIILSSLTISQINTAALNVSNLDTDTLHQGNLNAASRTIPTASALTMTNIDTANVQPTDVVISDIPDASLQSLYNGPVGQLTVNSFVNAENTIENVDNMLKSLDSYRADLGAATPRCHLQ